MISCPHCAEPVPEHGGWCPHCQSKLALPQPATMQRLPVDNTYAWALTAVPAFVVLAAIAFPSIGWQGILFVGVAANWFLGWQDTKRVAAAGYGIPGGDDEAWLAGFTAAILAPVYLFLRGRRVGTQVHLLVWVGVLVAANALGNVLATTLGGT